MKDELEEILDNYCPHYYSPEDVNGKRSCVLCHKIYESWDALPRPEVVRKDIQLALQNYCEQKCREARIDELKEFMSYDWYGTDDAGNENVYFNDEICEYAKARIKALQTTSEAE